MERRSFIQKLSAISLTSSLIFKSTISNTPPNSIVVATWPHKKAVKIAYQELQKSTALDAIEKGINHVELDPSDMSVGYGGRPDSSGEITLDACIMNHLFQAGSVACLKNIKTPISVARKVLSETPHVLLVGQGALDFAIAQGFNSEDINTKASKKAFKEWSKTQTYKPVINIENHDTIGMLALAEDGTFAGGCSTSGLGFKMPGRVGDSPIIGAGLYVDPKIGAATATGLGEKMLTNLASFAVVEFMRQGHSPEEACRKMINRIIANEQSDKIDFQVGLIAINNRGEYGAFSIFSDFSYTIAKDGKVEIHNSKYLFVQK